MKNWYAVLFLAVALIHFGAGEPAKQQSAGASSNTEKSTSKYTTMSPQGFVADQIAKFFGPKSGTDQKNDKAVKNQGSKKKTAAAKKKNDSSNAASFVEGAGTGVAPSAVVAAVPAGSTPKVFKLPPRPVSMGSASAIPKTPQVAKLAVPPPPAATPTVVSIRQEIQKILNLNKSIRDLRTNRAAQIQTVQEQARIHQKILDQMEAPESKQENTASGKSAPKKEALLAQEKLRIIHEETKRNAQMVETLDESAVKTDAKSKSAAKSTAKAGVKAKTKTPTKADATKKKTAS